jgi:isopenicillin N synthase-like dioxygenase
MDAVPLIDVSALRGSDPVALSALAREVGTACRETGFFAIEGHGVPAALVARAFQASADFFALAPQVKRALAIDRLGGNRGYVGLGVEALDEAAGGDHKEAFNVVWADDPRGGDHVWPTLPGFRDAVQHCFDAVLDLGRRLHVCFALDLGLPANFFDDKLDRPMATLRLLHYPPANGARSTRGAGAGAHTDYGNVTLLATDGVPGLQVRRRDGTWVDAAVPPDAFVCNIGDCLMRWTNDVYRSTPHRVVQPSARRRSIAVFVDPNPHACVSAIASCVPEGESPRHAPITAGEHLRRRLAATYGRPV